MTNTSFYFLVGSPGSAWSMIGQQLKDSVIGKFDHSDETGNQGYQIPDSHKKNYVAQNQNFHITTHKGAYFGPGHKYGSKFENLSYYSCVTDFYTECLRPFSGPESCKLIKSHWFAYNLDWLWENCKNQYLMMVWRDPKAAEDWWYQMGGWNIDYPIYTWYGNPETMTQQIKKENQLLLDFASKKNFTWTNYDHQRRWLQNWISCDIINPVIHPRFDDVPQILLVKIV